MIKKNEMTDQLMKAVLSLSSVEECYDFFEDLCTIRELQDMSQRLNAALLLSEGLSYQQVRDKMEISTVTISRVSRCINYGSGGYAAAIKKLKGDNGNEA